MPEVNGDFPREWLEFPDPANELNLFKCDITWLTSYWNCIYGSGCQGIDQDKPDAGCCSDGAYYSDDVDEDRVLAAAKRLTPEIWQFYHQVRKSGRGTKLEISEVGLDRDRKTRYFEGSCIFLNRREFDGPIGCALHHLAVKEGRHFFETKPDVCWQLPIRRSFEKRELGDRELTVTVVGEYERLAWGDGGADFNWYCTANSDAHTGLKPVYLSNQDELIQLMGENAFGILAKHCDRRMELIKRTRRKSLPLLMIHPATTRAEREQKR